MLLPFNSYQTVLFDCDGVILNSNKIKTQAFYEIALPFGQRKADELVRYHIANGGISRYKKIHYFLSDICKIPFDSESFTIYYNQLLIDFRKVTLNNLLACEHTSALPYLKTVSSALWHVVSGSDENDLTSILENHQLSGFFSTINGSPRTKNNILESLNLIPPVLFIGDSLLDYDVSTSFDTDFLFLTSWSDIADNDPFLTNPNVCFADSLSTYAAQI